MIFRNALLLSLLLSEAIEMIGEILKSITLVKNVEIVLICQVDPL